MLRAKHRLSVFKDGTIRYDMTDLPLTHFIPREIGTDLDVLRGLGYTHDMHGESLESEEQVVELKVQDLIVSHSCGDYMLKVAQFVDDGSDRLAAAAVAKLAMRSFSHDQLYDLEPAYVEPVLARMNE